MLRFNAYGKTVEVSFRHNKDKKETECMIWVDDVCKAYGKSQCADCDIFSKRTGRKISLTRAMEKFPKQVRTFIWRYYFAKSNIKVKTNKFDKLGLVHA